MDYKKSIFAFALIMVLLATSVFAATTSTSGSSSSSNSAVLQIADYSTIPVTVYPGTAGYIKLTMSNSGTDTASGVTVYYSHSQSTGQMTFAAGDISTGSSTQLTVPFKAPSEVPTGIYNVNVDIYYSSSSSSASKKASISVPIQVAQYQSLEVSTLSTDRQSLAPGETASFDLLIKNKGGVMNNLVISTPANSSFTIAGTTEKSIGNLNSNSSANATLVLQSSSSTAVGQYTIPLTFTYQDVLGTTNTQTLYVGPVNILASSTQFMLSVVPEAKAEIGSQAKFQVTLENTGTSPLSATADLNSTAAFIPLGTTRLNFGTIAPGKKVTQEITIGISNSISAGYYTLPVAVTLGSGSSTTQNIGISVSATPEIAISVDTSSASLSQNSNGSKVTIQISNTGNSAIRSVYAKALAGDLLLTGAADKFIGTLNVDDYATLSLTVSVPRNAQAGAAGTYSLPIIVTFKDTNNELHTVNQVVQVAVQSGSSFGFNGGNGSASGAGFAGRNRGFNIFGFDLTQIGIGVVIIIAAFLGYKYFKGRGKKKESLHPGAHV